MKCQTCLFLLTRISLPDAVNGPDVILRQNAGMGRLSFLPDEAGRYRPMDGEDE